MGEGYLSHHSEAEKPLLGRGERKREFTERQEWVRDSRTQAGGGWAHPCPAAHSHLGRAAQVVIVHFLDGLEVDDPFQLRLMLVCQENRAGLRRPAMPQAKLPAWERGGFPGLPNSPTVLAQPCSELENAP